MRTGMVVLAVVASLPMGLLAIRAITITAAEASNPCFEWGSGSQTSSSGAISYSLRPNDPCANGRGGTSETKTHAIMRLLIVSGGILLAVSLGIAGSVLSRRGLLVLGAVMMFLEAVPLIFSVAPVAVLTSGAFLLAARGVGRHRPA
jgi:hypothetical protein